MMDSNDNLNELTSKSLISRACSVEDPYLSSIYVCKAIRWMEATGTLRESKSLLKNVCTYCGNVWNVKDLKVRTKSSVKTNKLLLKLLKKYERMPISLTKKDKKKIKLFIDNGIKTTYTCTSCNNKTSQKSFVSRRCSTDSKSNSSAKGIKRKKKQKLERKSLALRVHSIKFKAPTTSGITNSPSPISNVNVNKVKRNKLLKSVFNDAENSKKQSSLSEFLMLSNQY